MALCWPVLSAYVRTGTNARLHQRPLLLKEAIARVQSWRRLGITFAVAALAGALGWMVVEAFLPERSHFLRLMAGAAVIGLAYLPWLLISARNPE